MVRILILTLIIGLSPLISRFSSAQTYPYAGYVFPITSVPNIHCNGTTDDTAAINTWLAANPGAMLRIPANAKCLLDATVSTGTLVFGSGQGLVGDNLQTSIIKIKGSPSGAAAAAFYVNGSSYNTFRDFQIDASAMTGGGGFYLVNSDHTLIEHLESNHLYNPIYFTQERWFHIDDLHLLSTYGDYCTRGVSSQAKLSETIDFYDVNCSPNSNTATNCYEFIGSIGTGHLERMGCVAPAKGYWFQACSATYADCGTDTTAAPNGWSLHDIGADFAYDDVLQIDNATSIQIHSLYAHCNAAVSSTTTQAGVSLGTNATGIRIFGGEIAGCYLQGIYVNGVDTTIGGMVIENNSKKGNGNTAGIEIGGNATDVQILGGRSGITQGQIFGAYSQRFGLVIDSGAKRIKSSLDTGLGNVLGGWQDNSGGNCGNVVVEGDGICATTNLATNATGMTLGAGTLVNPTLGSPAIVWRSGPTANFTDTTALASNIVGAIPNAAVGQWITIKYVNMTNNVATLAGGTGVTITGTTTTAAQSGHVFTCVLNNVTSGSYAVTCNG